MTIVSPQHLDNHPSAQSSGRKAFLLIEGLRGIAALLVVTRHLPGFWSFRFPLSYLAVDLFFLMSGFVIVHSYENALQSSRLGMGKFFLLRLIRLYPLYLLFSLLGAFSLLVLRNNPAHYGFVPLLSGAFFLPVIDGTAPFFPFDHPAWSLFFELFISFLYGAGLWRLRENSLRIIAGLCFLGLAYGALRSPQDLDIGWLASNFGYGFLRVTFSFVLGMLIYHRYFGHDARPLPAQHSNRRAVIVLFCGLLLLAMHVRPGLPATLYGLLAISILFPLLLIWAISVWPSGHAATISKILGAVSYPVYVAHAPVFALLATLLIQNTTIRPHYGPLFCPVFIVVLVAACYYIDAYIDVPLRRHIRGYLERFGKPEKAVPGDDPGPRAATPPDSPINAPDMASDGLQAAEAGQ
jgi:peptidoglycan/LPS O-acetylase OafA/YrhL